MTIYIISFLILFIVTGYSDEKNDIELVSDAEIFSKIEDISTKCEESKELSKIEGISIKCDNEGRDKGNSIFELLGDKDNNITSFKMVAYPLGFLVTGSFENYWHKGLENLPEGNFTVEIKKKMPMTFSEYKNLVFTSLGEAFNLDINIRNYPWDGYKIFLPDERPKTFLSPKGNGWAHGTIGGGHYFKYCTIKDLENWLIYALDSPVDMIYKNDYEKFDFSLKYDVADHEDLINKLNKMGIKVIKGNVDRETVLIEKK